MGSPGVGVCAPLTGLPLSQVATAIFATLATTVPAALSAHPALRLAHATATDCVSVTTTISVCTATTRVLTAETAYATQAALAVVDASVPTTTCKEKVVSNAPIRTMAPPVLSNATIAGRMRSAMTARTASAASAVAISLALEGPAPLVMSAPRCIGEPAVSLPARIAAMGCAKTALMATVIVFATTGGPSAMMGAAACARSTTGARHAQARAPPARLGKCATERKASADASTDGRDRIAMYVLKPGKVVSAIDVPKGTLETAANAASAAARVR